MTSAAAADPWIVRFHPNPSARLRLFCFPYAGGGAPAFRGWGARLPDLVEVCAVQPPGRGSRIREEAFTRVGPLLDALEPALADYLDRPFAFFGHSMGAIVSYELAQRLRETGKTGPRHLFVSGRRAPHVPDPDPPTYDLPEPEFVEELRRLNGTPTEVLAHPELMELMLPLLRRDFELSQTYDPPPRPPVACPITAFGGAADRVAGREGLEAWREHTSAPFVARVLPGDHFFLHTSEAALLQIIARDLEAADSLGGNRR